MGKGRRKGENSKFEIRGGGGRRNGRNREEWEEWEE
jgi:hypothetical protein